MKFSMGADVLSSLSSKTSVESDDMKTLVDNFIAAAEPLRGKMSGPAKDAFDKFKLKSDEIAVTMNNALVGICGSIEGQDKSFKQGAQEGADVHSANEGSANFAGADVLARFAPR
ncbi:hypothetical protein [Micropruina sonneratiae]|uniref:hypothetical protein n=1 Tax=Micropruina sonneratiae TaxID=2986940 RepID=UPI002227B56C|nr:hypothetical protein [Micropruina sp. KQZ13P-5]MCW3156891.1 hypothetical protein [Micropruina sp. KQZ13P-5]